VRGEVQGVEGLRCGGGVWGECGCGGWVWSVGVDRLEGFSGGADAGGGEPSSAGVHRQCPAVAWCAT
jgi:hypothetical protein